MRTLILMGIFLNLFSPQAAALGAMEPMCKETKKECFQMPGPDEQVAEMDKIVGLSAAQKEKYKALIIKSDKEKKDLKEKLKNATPEEKKKERQKFVDDYEKEFKAILTPAQLKKFEAAASKSKSQK